jgi:hypothetical protein
MDLLANGFLDRADNGHQDAAIPPGIRSSIYGEVTDR